MEEEQKSEVLRDATFRRLFIPSAKEVLQASRKFRGHLRDPCGRPGLYYQIVGQAHKAGQPKNPPLAAFTKENIPHMISNGELGTERAAGPWRMS